MTWTLVGIMGATAAVAGQNLGAGKPERSVQGARVASWIGIAVAAMIGAVFLLLPEALLEAFGLDDPVVAALGTQLLAFLSVARFRQGHWRRIEVGIG